MKMIKLNTDHYVVVDDSEIKEGDLCYDPDGSPGHNGIKYVVRCLRTAPDSYWNKHCKKITHSTQPLEYSSKIGKYWGRVQPIELSEVKELLGEVDAKITDIAFKAYQKQDTWTWTQFQDIFPLGYNEALEDNKEKKWTDEDVINIVDNVSQNWFKCYSHNDKKEHLLKITKYLQKTEWEVEIINDKLKLKQ